MHSDLSSHLHTAECNEIIFALKNCRKQHPYTQLLGACNDFDRAMTKCIQAELETKRRAKILRRRAKMNKDT